MQTLQIITKLTWIGNYFILSEYFKYIDLILWENKVISNSYGNLLMILMGLRFHRR